MRFVIKLLQILLGSLFALMTLGALVLFGLYSHYYPQLPDEKELGKIEIQVPLRIYTRDNKLVAEYGVRRSRPVTLDEVPDQLKNAFIAIEDARFYEHNGIDFKSVLRAVRSVLSNGYASQGASTITMQLARNAFLNTEKTMERKFKEALLAIKMEQNLSKAEILEVYLNKIYLGNRAYGIAAAAETYYGKTLDELTLAQAAMIAGLPKAPSRYNPIANPERAMIRRNYILKRMMQLKYISHEQYQVALDEPNTAKPHKPEIETQAPYLAEMVRAEIVKRFGIENAYTQGYHVYTTLDSDLQAKAAAALRNALQSYDERHGYRGAEDKLKLGDFDNEEQMRDKLFSYPVFGDLQPALVLSAGNKTAELLVGESRIVLDLQAVKWAREFKSANRRGRAPDKVSDVLAPGDVVRVRQTDKEKNLWKLSQVPGVGGALVSLDPENGAVRAVMGGFDYYYSKFNRATQAMRQPGSSFKPFVYSAALAKGFSPTSIVNDAPISIPGSDWKPQNFGGRYIGPTTLEEALAKSRNLVSIRLMRTIGISYTVDYATRFGFSEKNLPKNLTLALGTNMTTPMEMATAYATFANGGFKVESHFINRIENQGRRVLYEHKPAKVCGDDVEVCLPESADQKVEGEPTAEADPGKQDPLEVAGALPAAKRIMDNRTHYQIVNMMQGVTQFGTAARAGRALKRKDIAGKTGTTNDQKDSWFCGFTPDVVTVTWVGFDDMAELGEGETATNVALPMWIDFMKQALDGVPVRQWDRPSGLLKADLDTGDKIRGDRQAVSTVSGGDFQYRHEADLVSQRTRQASAPQLARPPERVEIPEQLF